MTLVISLIILLLVLSAFFSGSETALTGASRAKIHKLKKDGNKRAIMVSNLRNDKDKLIGAILFCNNAVNIAASALATTIAISYLGNEGVFYVTIIMTFLILIFSEVMPKTYAFKNAERVALTVAPAFMVLVKILTPITFIVQTVVNITMYFFGAKKNRAEEIVGTDALRGAIELHHDEGAVVKDDRDMLGSILDLSETEVGEIMIHRKEIKAISVDESIKNITGYILENAHARIPLWKDNPDNIVGILHSKNLMHALLEHRHSTESLDLTTLLAQPWFIPETTTLKDQMKAFREKHHHFALVVDEYGALLGLITLKDILEEIVGQINEEQTSDTKIKKNTDGSYMVNGNVTIRDFNRELDWNLPDNEASTIAGLIIYEAQLIPDSGQVFHFHDCQFEIVKKQRNQIIRIKVTRDCKKLK